MQLGNDLKPALLIVSGPARNFLDRAPAAETIAAFAVDLADGDTGRGNVRHGEPQPDAISEQHNYRRYENGVDKKSTPSASVFAPEAALRSFGRGAFESGDQCRKALHHFSNASDTVGGNQIAFGHGRNVFPSGAGGFESLTGISR